MATHRILAACLAMVSCMGQSEPPLNAAPMALADPAAAPIGALDVMTYNVKGLPWPVAIGRHEPLAAIGTELAAMRRAGRQPQVVVLQEAFTQEAREIGMLAGYPHIAYGPDAEDAAVVANPISGAFSAAADWTRGEGPAPVLGSGLVILSDYPIVRQASWAFPQGACAGFDCLAAKGVLVAWIAMPGHAEPVAVATTHLNSRKSAGVDLARSDEAFAWQWRAARRFLARELAAGEAAVFAGDFNLGGNASRFGSARRAGLALPRGRDAVAAGMATGRVAARDMTELRDVLAKKTDRQLFRSSPNTRLIPASLAIAFPETGTETPLSDHPGVVVRYRINSL